MHVSYHLGKLAAAHRNRTLVWDMYAQYHLLSTMNYHPPSPGSQTSSGPRWRAPRLINPFLVELGQLGAVSSDQMPLWILLLSK
jgi:hypothetical protein